MSAEILLETASLIGVCTQLQTIHTDQSKRQSLRSSFLIMCFKFSQLFENEGCGIFITFTIMVLCIMLDLCTKTLTFVDVFKVFTFENIKLEYYSNSRMDEKQDGDTFKWLMISWSPDSASIRNKMLYASTKATLKKEFGGGQIMDELYGNDRVSI